MPSAIRMQKNEALPSDTASLKQIAEQIYSAEQAKGFNLQNLNHNFEKEAQALKSEIDELQRRKNLNTASLLGYMRENNFKDTSTLSALLKDEVLYLLPGSLSPR